LLLLLQLLPAAEEKSCMNAASGKRGEKVLPKLKLPVVVLALVCPGIDPPVVDRLLRFSALHHGWITSTCCQRKGFWVDERAS
jgi:hypothetical protein